MQSGFCVYCESSAIQGTGHIEHFFHKGKKTNGIAPYKHLTFDWSNLFGCCGQKTSDSCGHYKDRNGSSGPGPYDPNDLIKPDVDDPRDYFNFLTTGVIEPKPELPANLLKKATETLRVLNLSLLNGVRKKQIDIFRKELDALFNLSPTLDDQALLQEINNIKAKVKVSEYQTAVFESLFS